MGSRFRMARARPNRARHVPGTMNKLEAAYADELKWAESRAVCQAWGFETITLKLAQDTRYTPDFWVLNAVGELEFHEVKGFMEDDAWVKLKFAAEKFPWAHFILVTRQAKKAGGAWVYRRVGEEARAGQ